MARNKLRKEKELNQIKKSTNVFFNIIFIILSALCIFPIVFVFSISISSETSIQKNGYQLIPQELSAAAYQFLWNERGTILHATFISILVTALGIPLYNRAVFINFFYQPVCKQNSCTTAYRLEE